MRPDGKKVKTDDIMYSVVPYIMTKRNDAMNLITIDVPIDPLHQYINAQRKQGRAISHMALIIASYLQTLAAYPLLNRFVVNRKLYDRYEICVAMVVLKHGEDDSTMSKMYFELSDNVFTVQQKIDDYLIKNTQEGSVNSTDKTAKILGRVPFLLALGVPVLKFLDRYGLMPKSLIDVSPFHTSLSISNLASIRTNHVYHHIYNFGTTSLFITMGNMRNTAVSEKGEIVFKRCLPLGISMDERICSGHYFAQAFSKFSRLLANPQLLEKSAVDNDEPDSR